MRQKHHFLVALAAFGVFFLSGHPVARADDDPQIKRALSFNDVTGDDPIRAEIKSLVEDPANTKKLLAAALAVAKKKDHPFNYNGALILAQAARILKDNTASEAFFRICIDQAGKLRSARKSAQAYDGLLDVLYGQKKYEECVKLCKDYLELDREVDDGKMEVLEVMVQALAKQGKTEEAMKMVDRFIRVDPDNWVFLELKSFVLYEAGKYQDAAKTYIDVLGLVAKDARLTEEGKTKLTERYRYLLSNTYIEARDIDKAAEWLRKLLADNPNHPTYNNDLGYVLADHDKELDEAERLIRKALEEDRKLRKSKPGYKEVDDKDVAAYLDSLGWVLYKKKQTKEAKKYLLEAVKDKEGQHIEIFDHLADVHMALGEKQDAIAVWKKAIEIEPATKREQQRKASVEKKLKEAQQ